VALTWLDDLEDKLTDGFVADLKRDHISAKADADSRVPISTAAHALLADLRAKGDNSLRIFFPVNQTDYLFLWGNDRFKYCDVRKLVREQTEQMDQNFIDVLVVKAAHIKPGYIQFFGHLTSQGGC